MSFPLHHDASYQFLSEVEEARISDVIVALKADDARIQK